MTDIYETIVTMTVIMNRCTFDGAGNARCNRKPNADENRSGEGGRR